MSRTLYPSWIETMARLIEDVRRLDLKIENDTRLEPAPTTTEDQLHTSIWSKTRVTSRGELLAEFEYSGCVRFHYQAGTLEAAEPARQPEPQAPALGNGAMATL